MVAIARYRAISADKQTLLRAKRPKLGKLQVNVTLKNIVANKISDKWSPEQISGYLKRIYSKDKAMHVSHETIYRALYIQSCGMLKKELQKNLRTKRVMRQSKKFNTKGNARGGIIDAVSIHDRPVEVNDRAILGHWEGDLICGSNQSYIATLVERTSRFTLLVKLVNNTTTSVVNAITKKIANVG